MLPHAPGVQMQAVPEDAVPDDNMDEDTEDPDKRLSSTTLTHTKATLEKHAKHLGVLHHNLEVLELSCQQL